MAEKIEFQDIHSLYPVSKPLWVTFRYSSSYSTSENDWIGLYKVGQTGINNPLVEVQVGNPEGHWSLENGQWRAGSVSLVVSDLPPGGQLQLWYISGQEVVGKSREFVLTLDSPSRTDSESSFSRSWDKVNDSRSSCDSKRLSEQLSSIGSGSQLGSSFTNVISPQNQKVISGFVDLGMPSTKLDSDLCLVESYPQPTSDFVDINVSPQLNSSFTLVKEEDSYGKIDTSEYEVVKTQVHDKSDSEMKDTQESTDDQLPVIALYFDESAETEDVSQVVEVESRPSPVPSKVEEKLSDTVSGHIIHLNEVPEPVVKSSPDTNAVSPFDALSPTVGSDSEPLPSPGAEADLMSSSTVFVDQFTSQKEAKILKNHNKELRQKLKKLTKLMETLQQEKLALQSKTVESNSQLSAIRDLDLRLKQAEEEKRKLEEQCQLLHNEKEQLKEKLYAAQNECRTQVERSADLLSKVQEYETQNTVLVSENEVLKGKLHQLEQAQKHERKERRREKERLAERKVQEHHKSHHAVPSKPLATKNEHQDSKPKALNSETKVGEQKLHQVIPKPRKDRHYPQAEPKPKDKEIAPSTSRPTELPLGLTEYPTPAPRHNKGTKKGLDGSKAKPVKQRETKQPAPQEYLHQKVPQEDKNGSLSEGRIQEIVTQLRGEGHGGSSPIVVCPVCQKQLLARENDYGVLLHVEHCLSQQ